MRSWTISRLVPCLLVCLPFAGCSCQHQTPDQAVAVVAPEAPATSGSDRGAEAGEPAETTAAAQARAAEQATATLHAYLGALPASDRSRADAYWSGGRPGTGDAVLREIPDLESMRVQNAPPVALDSASPPRAFEIPVELRLHTQAGAARLEGTYRLRERGDGRGWEITSASLRAALD